jgi:hypothetical protein
MKKRQDKQPSLFLQSVCFLLRFAQMNLKGVSVVKLYLLLAVIS